MGRPPIPTQLKILKGTYRADRDPRTGPEPLPPSGRPRKPRGLDSVASAEWEFILSQLEKMQLLNQADRPLLEAYVRTYSEWRRLCRQVEREGATITEVRPGKYGDAKVVKRHPAHEAKMECQREMDRLLTRFGFSPAAGTKLAVHGRENGRVLRRRGRAP